MTGAICQSNKDIPVDMTLGNLLYYSLSDVKIKEQELMDLFSMNKIPTSYIRKISTPDAFRRASSSIKNTTIFITDSTTGETMKTKVEVDEVKSDDTGIKRIIGIKAIDEKNEDISYIPVATVEFFRKNETVATYVEPAYASNQNICDLCDEIENKYAEWSVYHTKDTVRNTILRIINDTHPVSLTPTGLCKFVPRSHTDLLYSLKETLKEMENYCINPGEHNFMEVIPVINTEEQQGLIMDASKRELKEELFGFTQELKDVLQVRQTLSSRTVASYLERFKTLSEKVSDYENLLGNYLGFLKTQITDAVSLVKDSSEDNEAEAEPVYV